MYAHNADWPTYRATRHHIDRLEAQGNLDYETHYDVDALCHHATPRGLVPPLDCDRNCVVARWAAYMLSEAQRCRQILQAGEWPMDQGELTSDDRESLVAEAKYYLGRARQEYGAPFPQSPASR